MLVGFGSGGDWWEGDRGETTGLWVSARWIWEDPEVEGETRWSGGAAMEWMGHLLDFRVWS